MTLSGRVPVEGDTKPPSKHPAGLEIAYSPSWQQMADLDNASCPNEYFNVSQTPRVGVGR